MQKMCIFLSKLIISTDCREMKQVIDVIGTNEVVEYLDNNSRKYCMVIAMDRFVSVQEDVNGREMKILDIHAMMSILLAALLLLHACKSNEGCVSE